MGESAGHDEHAAGHEHLRDAARHGSGIGTVYLALDELVAARGLDDATLVVDVPGLGRQVLHAGRRPLRDDEHGILTRAPGLYVEPAGDDDAQPDEFVSELMVAIGVLGLRHDTGRRIEGVPTEDAPS